MEEFEKMAAIELDEPELAGQAEESAPEMHGRSEPRRWMRRTDDEPAARSKPKAPMQRRIRIEPPLRPRLLRLLPLSRQKQRHSPMATKKPRSPPRTGDLQPEADRSPNQKPTRRV